MKATLAQTTTIQGRDTTGTRHRFYWPCPHCGQHFEVSFAPLRWDAKDQDGAPLAAAAPGESPEACGGEAHHAPIGAAAWPAVNPLAPTAPVPPTPIQNWLRIRPGSWLKG